jgi:hypothetical protein|nr:MAG TPA: tail assembly chaperone protein [Caudoviricetes sp.]
MNNLVDRLMKVDKAKIGEMRTGVFKSQKLADIIGETEPVEIKIHELKGRRMNALQSEQIKNDGTVDFEKAYDTQLRICVEGISEPNLKDKELQQHLGCSLATELCEKIFNSEVSLIADEIVSLGIKINDKETENEIKNS